MVLRAALIAALFVAIAVTTQASPAAADDEMQWQFYEYSESNGNGAKSASLIYGVPETDDVQVMGSCQTDARTGTMASRVTFGADIGDLSLGKDASLRFSGGGFEQTLKGTVARTDAEGLSGIILDIGNDDPLWTAFAEKETLDYMVPGYRAATLDLANGRDNIAKFVGACRSYDRAAEGADAGVDTKTPGRSFSPEKEAFESAKELGTVAAFEAFLSNYSAGFYADLARAYIDEIGGAGKAAPSPTPLPPTPKPQTAQDLRPDPSCKDLSREKSGSGNVPTKITFVNESGAYRSILWIDRTGHPKDYAGLNSGEEVTLDTFLGHPWMIADGPGDCLRIVMPHPGARIVTLTGGAAKAPPAPAPKKAQPAPKTVTPKCRPRSILIDGKCILRRNAASYCGPGYRLAGNKCVQGYEEPKRRRLLPDWQLEGLRHGCAPGLAWNAQEGCHEND